jgi:hypothetical protein
MSAAPESLLLLVVVLLVLAPVVAELGAAAIADP